MNRTMLKLAASALILSVVSVATATAISPKSLKEAAKAADKAARALKGDQREDAVRYAERAVLYNPADADSRALLGQAYLQSGRFVSAEQAFSDALRLAPEHGRAALGFALASTALGKISQAMDALTHARGHVPDADYGLALALAGDPKAAIGILEPAARLEGATAKVRQNLAFAYALGARWDLARTTAAQDLSPGLLDKRMSEWAQLARPVGSADQVASLLGVRPVHDGGLPTALALVETPAAPQAEAVASVPVAEPSFAQQSAPQAAPLLAQASEPVVQPEETQATPLQPIPAPQPASKPYLMMASAAAAHADAQPIYVKPVPVPASRSARGGAADGNFVIQLGAFSSHDRLERAWTGAVKQLSWLDGYNPVSTTFTAQDHGRTLYRLAVSGFSGRLEAVNLCRKMRALGADCFVRGKAGDAPVQWVSRKADTRYAAR